ncbi:MAG: hypothetical protein JOZ22_19295 [Acidobacteriia bacterium]|nr:hypothetical protein [Terriglobia bacterium]
MTNEEPGFDALLASYRHACPDVEPGANFMPRVWEKIEARRGFWFVFLHEARTALTACAALCLILLLLNFIGGSSRITGPPTYADALMAEHTAEQTYFTEGIRAVPVSDITER